MDPRCLLDYGIRAIQISGLNGTSHSSTKETLQDLGCAFNSSVSTSQLRKIKLQFVSLSLPHNLPFFLQICIKSINFIELHCDVFP